MEGLVNSVATLLVPVAMLGLFAAPAIAQSTVGNKGIVPQGFWILNPSRSRSLSPGRQTLWVVKDDGRHLVWTSAVIDDQHRVQIISYDGEYGGDPKPVSGTPMTTKISIRGADALHNEGAVAGMGAYHEDCRVSSDRLRFRCEGEVLTAKGTVSYVDDFDWYGPSPPAARP